MESSPRPLSHPDIFFLGAYAFTSPRVVPPAEASRLRVHLVKSFWKNGVRFAPAEVQVSSARTGTDLNPRSEITVVFPVRACPTPLQKTVPPRPPKKVAPKRRKKIRAR